VDRVCELNVRAQVQSVCHSPIVRSAWERGQALTIHGWIYRLTEGLLRDLQCGRSSLPA
jgi:carbonic anhydrase